MTRTKDKYADKKPEKKYPKALGKYVDLRVIDGMSVGSATTKVADLYGEEAAAWCRSVCGDRT